VLPNWETNPLVLGIRVAHWIPPDVCAAGGGASAAAAAVATAAAVKAPASIGRVVVAAAPASGVDARPAPVRGDEGLTAAAARAAATAAGIAAVLSTKLP
jgi:hypothetical protein